MGLFKTPKRKEVNIESILSVVENESIPKSKIKLRGTSLLAKLKAIEETVEKNLGDEKDNYLLITSDDEWLQYCKDACSYEYVAYDTECDSLDNMLANIAGVCIKSSGLKSAYVPVGHISTITDKLVSNQVSKEAIRKGLQMLVDANVKFLMHNGYFDIVLTYQQIGIMLPVYFDTMIWAGLLDENEPHGLKYLYAKYCNHSDNFHKFGELFDGIPINCIPYKVAGVYGQFDAVQTEALAFW